MTDSISKLPIQEQAKFVVMVYVNNHLDKSDKPPWLQNDDVYVVWFSKTLQNWKALLSTALLDGMYYEVTYNGDKDEIYLDAYKKFENVRISLGEDIEQLSLEGSIQQAVGHASMCWDPRPEGVFDSEEAGKVAAELTRNMRARGAQ